MLLSLKSQTNKNGNNKFVIWKILYHHIYMVIDSFKYLIFSLSLIHKFLNKRSRTIRSIIYLWSIIFMRIYYQAHTINSHINIDRLEGLQIMSILYITFKNTIYAPILITLDSQNLCRDESFRYLREPLNNSIHNWIYTKTKGNQVYPLIITITNR